MTKVKAYKSNGKIIEACDVEEITAYKSIDGNMFESEDKALEHDEIVRNTDIFAIYAHPDLTSGSRGAGLEFLVTINAESNRRDLVEYLCYKKFGNRLNFVMGVKCSNNIMEAWDVVKVEREDLNNYLKNNIKIYYLDVEGLGVFNEMPSLSILTMDEGFI